MDFRVLQFFLAGMQERYFIKKAHGECAFFVCRMTGI